MKNLSVIIITLNEEQNIQECLQSVSWADEIVLVDSQSTDRTVKIARQFTNKVYVVKWMGYSANKNYALEKTTNEWILWLDADERVTPELKKEIQGLLSSEISVNGFEVARRAFFLKKWIRHCGWYPGYVLRLFKKGSARFTDSKVHEGLELKGPRNRLKYDLLHYTDDDLEHYMWKFNRYTTLAADDLYTRGRNSGVASILVRPVATFVKMYFLKKGFLDGVEGLMLCLLSSGYVAMKYAKLWEANRN